MQSFRHLIKTNMYLHCHNFFRHHLTLIDQEKTWFLVFWKYLCLSTCKCLYNMVPNYNLQYNCQGIDFLWEIRIRRPFWTLCNINSINSQEVGQDNFNVVLRLMCYQMEVISNNMTNIQKKMNSPLIKNWKWELATNPGGSTGL